MLKWKNLKKNLNENKTSLKKIRKFKRTKKFILQKENQKVQTKAEKFNKIRNPKKIRKKRVLKNQ